MILGMLMLPVFVGLSLAAVALVIAGGPWMWLTTTLLVCWLGRRCLRWMINTKAPVSREALLPPRR